MTIGALTGVQPTFFNSDSNGWAEVAKLTASDAASFDNFGYSVSVSGNTAVISSYGDDLGSSSGSAYVFNAL